MMNHPEMLRVDNLEKHFPLRGGFFSRKKGQVQAISGISFKILRGETLGLVGESGCGKTTVGLCIMRIIEPNNGKIFFGGEDVTVLDEKKKKLFRRRAQIIFQDPYGSLDPKWTVGRIIAEGMVAHGIARGKELEERIDHMLEKVGMNPRDKVRRPNEFSGGQRQRIAIARALIFEPELVIGDEPLSALDVSIQAQVINLLTNLQREFKFSYLMISHDLSVVKYMSDHIAVMYLGKIVEIARSIKIYQAAKHPYTLALLSAVPIPDPNIRKERIILSGDIPSPINPPAGCRFNTRCTRRSAICGTEEPQLRKIDDSHYCACHLY